MDVRVPRGCPVRLGCRLSRGERVRWHVGWLDRGRPPCQRHRATCAAGASSRGADRCDGPRHLQRRGCNAAFKGGRVRCTRLHDGPPRPARRWVRWPAPPSLLVCQLARDQWRTSAKSTPQYWDYASTRGCGLSRLTATRVDAWYSGGPPVRPTRRLLTPSQRHVPYPDTSLQSRSRATSMSTEACGAPPISMWPPSVTATACCA